MIEERERMVFDRGRRHRATVAFVLAAGDAGSGLDEEHLGGPARQTIASAVRR
jgi:hypothetical protein